MSEYTEERLIRAKNDKSDFEQWVNKNGDIWAAFCDDAARLALDGSRVSAKYLAEKLRARDYTDYWGNPAKCPNDWTPLVGRQLVKECPELEPYVIIRHSIFDEV